MTVFFLTYVLPFFRTYLLTFYLTFLLAYLPALFSDTISDISCGVLWIFSDVLSPYLLKFFTTFFSHVF